MNPFHCSPEKPWGIHPPVLSDEACSRCGWIAPGPIGDARDDAAAAAAETGAAAANGWIVYRGGQQDGAAALAA